MELGGQIWLDIINELKSQGLRDALMIWPYLIWLFILWLPLRSIFPEDTVSCIMYSLFMAAAGLLLLITSDYVLNQLSRYITPKQVGATAAFAIIAAYRYRKGQPGLILEPPRKGKNDSDTYKREIG